MTVPPGELLPDVAVVGSDGARTSLRDLRGEATLLVFLRHLG